MIRTFRAELSKLLRPRLILLTLLVTVAIAVGGSAALMGSAVPAAEAGPGEYSSSIEGLADAGGGTELFRGVAASSGMFLFVLFVGIFALEFSRGTYRTMLLRQPKRPQLLAGKLLAPLVFMAVTIAVAELVVWGTAIVLAPGFDIATDAWTSGDAVAAAVTDYAAILLWMTGYAVFGMALAVVLRSVPVAMAVGVAWAMPFEHILSGPWPTAQQVFPGLLLEAVADGGRPEVTAGTAAITAVLYMLVAAGIAGAVFTRRDVTA